MTMIRKGDDCVVLITRPELDDADWFVGRTGRVLSVQQGTGDVLLKFKGRAWPVAFPQTSVATRHSPG